MAAQNRRSNRFYYSDDDEDGVEEAAPLLQLEDLDDDGEAAGSGSDVPGPQPDGLDFHDGGEDDVEAQTLVRDGRGPRLDPLHPTAVVVGSPGEGGRDGHREPRWKSKWYQVRSPGAVVAVVAVMLFGVLLGATLLLIPLARMIEANVCERHYGTREPVEESRCKIDEVQARLAWLAGIGSFITSVIELIVSLPWGVVSDRSGRKPILRLSFLGMFLSGSWSMLVVLKPETLPVELALLGPVFFVIGGGPGVTSLVINSIVADVATETASAFAWIGIGAVAGGITGPALAAVLMEAFSPWVPIYISSGILLPSILSIGLLPETRPGGKASSGLDPKAAWAPTSSAGPTRGDGGNHQTSVKTQFKRQARESLVELRSSLKMLENSSLLCIMPVFFVLSPSATVQGAVLSLTLGRKLKWTIAETGYFFSGRGLLTVLALALLPLVARPSTFRRDLGLARVAFALLLAGNVLTGFVDALPVFVAGQLLATLAVGAGSLVRSLSARLVRPEQTSRLFALAGMAETLGALLGGPSLAWVFGRGVQAGGMWVGLPFWCVAALCGLALVALGFVRRPVDSSGDRGDGTSSPAAGGREEEHGRFRDEEEQEPLIRVSL